MYYSLTEKQVKVEGRSYKAYYPTEHSRVEAVIYSVYDQNAGDPWANIKDNHLTMFILYKGHKEWIKEYDGRAVSYNGNYYKESVHDVLFFLESEKNRQLINAKEKVEELKKFIKEYPSILEEKEKKLKREEERIQVLEKIVLLEEKL